MYLRVHFYAAMYLLYQSRGGLATEAAGRPRDVCGRFGGVRSVRGAGGVSACGEECDVWVGEVSG